MERCTRRLALALAALLVCAWSAHAQQAAASAAVSGVVKDASAAAVAGASVTIRNHATNQRWDATTDQVGRYRFLYLPTGDYHLSVESPGFAIANVNLTLGVGAAVDVPVTLTPAVASNVEVTAAAPLVEAARTEAAATIAPREIQTLPLNGRNYLDLALLAPNVSRTNTRSNDRFAETSAVPGTGISVSGQRNLANNFIVDGLSANDDAADLAGAYFSEEVIREFQVITSGANAEFGRAAAGSITVVTESGTNDPHGRAYEFFRNDALDARNPLAARKDPLTQHQFGVTFGGPVVKDRTFWFGNVERTAQDRVGLVTIAPSAVAAVNGGLDASGYPGPRIATGEFPAGYHTINLFGRLDHQLDPASRVETRYSFYDVGSPNARNAGALNDVSRGTRLDNRDQTVAVSWLSSPSASLFNETRGQWTRSRLSAGVNDAHGPAVNVAGVASWGTATFSPTGRDLDVLEIADTLSAQRGDHLIKGGADLLYNRLDIAFPGALQGVYTFASLADFDRGTYVNYQQAFGNPDQFQSNPNLGLFAQDEWRPRPGLTVDAGVRYDLQWLPSPIQLDGNNVSPRIGAAWAPGDGRTVVRGSAGIYFDRIPLRAVSNALQRDGLNYRVAVLSFGEAAAPVFPATLPAFPSGVLTAITTIDPHIQNGRTEQYSIQLERAIGSVASATLGYSRLRGHEIVVSRNVNVPTLTPAEAAARGVANLGRPDSRFGNVGRFESAGDSWFDGLTASVQTRTAAWGSARASYTWSKAIDDAGNAFFSTPQDNDDLLADKGPSDNDQRHRVVLAGSIAALRVIDVGWLFSFATGVPFNVLTGTDRNHDTNANDRPIGVARNSERQPSTSSFDLRISRTLKIGATQRIDLLAEAFNLFNHVNVLNVNATFGSGSTPAPSFGAPIAAGDPRQVQLGVRWNF